VAEHEEEAGLLLAKYPSATIAQLAGWLSPKPVSRDPSVPPAESVHPAVRSDRKRIEDQLIAAKRAGDGDLASELEAKLALERVDL
jgi:hypothetical protein